MPRMKTAPKGSATWTRVAMPGGAALFIVALAVSAVAVPRLRVLHVLQALIYVAVILLSRRNKPEGFGAAISIAVVWNCLNLFITHLTQAGTHELWLLFTTGHVRRLDTMMVAVGSLAHFIMIAAGAVGFLQLARSKDVWWRFLAGGFVALAYLALIVAAAAPR